MATKRQVGGRGTLFVGEDKTIEFLDVVDDNGDLIDMSAWPITFVVAKTSSGTALVTKSATVAGIFNSNPALNTQKAVVEVTDSDLSASVFNPAGKYLYSLKRTTDGSETVLVYGPFVIERATQA